jgi:hypothetical protein
MSIDYSNVENGLPKADKNGFFFQGHFLHMTGVLISGFRVLGFGVLGIMSSRVMTCTESRIVKSLWD